MSRTRPSFSCLWGQAGGAASVYDAEAQSACKAAPHGGTLEEGRRWPGGQAPRRPHALRACRIRGGSGPGPVSVPAWSRVVEGVGGHGPGGPPSLPGHASGPPAPPHSIRVGPGGDAWRRPVGVRVRVAAAPVGSAAGPDAVTGIGGWTSPRRALWPTCHHVSVHDHAHRLGVGLEEDRAGSGLLPKSGALGGRGPGRRHGRTPAVRTWRPGMEAARAPTWSVLRRSPPTATGRTPPAQARGFLVDARVGLATGQQGQPKGRVAAWFRAQGEALLRGQGGVEVGGHVPGPPW